MKYRIFIAGLTLLLLASMATSLIHPNIAYAAQTGTWIDAAHIKIGSNNYVDGNLEFNSTGLDASRREFFLNNQPKACVDYINNFNGTYTQATLTHAANKTITTGSGRGSSTSTKCTFISAETVSLSNAFNSYHDFAFKDSSEIDRVDGNETLAGSKGVGDFKQTGTSCGDVIAISGDATQSHNAIYALLTKHNSVGTRSQVSCQQNGNPFTVSIGNYDKSITAPGTGTSGGATGGKVGDLNPTCETNGFGLNWVLCPIFNGVADFSDWMFTNLVQPLLQTTPISTDANSASFKIWSSFRIYGNIILIISLLVLVFGQSIGGGLFEAYTVKKIMPRILIAAILINLSVYIVAFLVDATNILGAGVGNLMIAPIREAAQFKFSPSGIQIGGIVGAGSVGLIGTFLTGIIWTGIIGKAATFVALFVLLPAVLGILAAFLTMIVRQGIILALILVSPVAFALYCLPNTEKYFKQWWDFLVKALLVYPIVVVMFSVADILSVTIMKANGITGNAPLLQQSVQGISSTLGAIVAFVALFLPLVLIPWAFKLAGGLVGNVVGTLTGHGGRIGEAIKGNANDPNSLRNRTKRNLGEQFTRGQTRTVDASRTLGASRWQRFRGSVSRRAWAGLDERQSKYMSAAREREEQMSATGRDALRYAGAGWTLEAGEVAPAATTSGGASVAGSVSGSRRFFDSKGREISGALYSEGKARHGGTHASVAQNLEYTVRKVQTDDDMVNYRTALARNAVANNWSSNEVMDAHAAAVFAHKDKFIDEWFSSPQAIDTAGNVIPTTDTRTRTAGIRWRDVTSDPDKRRDMVGELHKTRQSFQMGALRDSAWRSMYDSHLQVQQRIASGTATPDDLTEFAQTEEILDTMTQRGLVQMQGEGEVSVAGASPAATGVIKAMYANRTYGVAAAVNPVNRQSSANVRAIYKLAPVEAVRNTRGATPAAISAAVAYNTVGNAVVTGDQTRSTLPRQAP